MPGYKMTFRRLQQALSTMMDLLKKGNTVVASTVWGLLRSYAAFMPADQSLLLSFLSRLCAAMPVTASNDIAMTRSQADLPAWEIAARALETQLSAVETMVAGIAAAALAECCTAAHPRLQNPAADGSGQDCFGSWLAHNAV